MKDLKEMFPHISQSTIDANPQIQPGKIVSVTPAGRMNRTEAEYALILEAQKRANQIHRYEFEGVTLRFAGVRYTPDFAVIVPGAYVGLGKWIYETKFIEIKGRYISGKFERAIERFRHARTYYPEFTFEMMQKTKDGWKQIL